MLEQLLHAYLLIGFCYAVWFGCKVHFAMPSLLSLLGAQREIRIREEWVPLLLVIVLIWIALTWPIHVKSEPPTC